MPFDLHQFKKSSLAPRTARVDVPALSPFFGADEPPVWEVRGLSANEIAKANEAETKNQRLDSMITVLEAVNQSEQINGLRESLGLGGNTHSEVIRRIEQLVMGSINPTITTDLAVRLAEHYPIEFYQITNEILKLTGMGSEIVKKPMPSGVISE